MEELDNIVYKPCKCCGSRSYKDTKGEKFVNLADGRIAVTPNTCDKCDFDIMIPETNYLH